MCLLKRDVHTNKIQGRNVVWLKSPCIYLKMLRSTLAVLVVLSHSALMCILRMPQTKHPREQYSHRTKMHPHPFAPGTLSPHRVCISLLCSRGLRTITLCLRGNCDRQTYPQAHTLNALGARHAQLEWHGRWWCLVAHKCLGSWIAHNARLLPPLFYLWCVHNAKPKRKYCTFCCARGTIASVR